MLVRVRPGAPIFDFCEFGAGLSDAKMEVCQIRRLARRLLSPPPLEGLTISCRCTRFHTGEGCSRANLAMISTRCFANFLDVR